MNVTMSPCIAHVHPSLSSLGSMASKRAWSKDTDESATGDAVEQVFMIFLIYEDTNLLVGKDIKLKWQDINDAFLGAFGEDLEDCKVYVNIHKYGLYQIAFCYLAFPCMDMIHWIISHTDPEMMALSSVSGTMISTFTAQDYQQM